MLIDLHADTPMWMRWTGYDLRKQHRPRLPRGAWLGHLDLPRMEQVGMDAQMFGLVAVPWSPNPFRAICGQVEAVQRAVRISGGRLQLVRSYASLVQARESGARAALLCLEGVHPLRGKMERLDQLVERGVAAFGLAHFHANEACRPAIGIGRDDSVGLSPFGIELVRRIGEQGLLVDLTHINRRGFFDVIEHAAGGLFMSHTGVVGAHAHRRNIDDQQIRAVSDSGGVVGVIFARIFLGGDDLEAVVRHVVHLIKVGGESVAALGSDFDGMIVPVRGLDGIGGLPRLRVALEQAGLTARVVDGIMGDNAARFFESRLMPRAMGDLS